jgi:hypothetical protein
MVCPDTCFGCDPLEEKISLINWPFGEGGETGLARQEQYASQSDVLNISEC